MRETGFYWIRLHVTPDVWEVAYWNGAPRELCWFMVGESKPIESVEVEEAGARVVRQERAEA